MAKLNDFIISIMKGPPSERMLSLTICLQTLQIAEEMCKAVRPIGGRMWSPEQSSVYEALTYLSDIFALHREYGQKLLTNTDAEFEKNKAID